MTWLTQLIRFWGRLDGPVDRRTYCLNGFALAAVKYLGDVAFFALGTGRFWKPTDYLHVSHSLLWTTLQGTPEWLFPVLGIWALPFIWIGVILTLRRALDAGRSPWWTLGFFVPYFNYVVMGAFCFIPSSARFPKLTKATQPAWQRLPSALLSIAGGIILGIVMVLCSVVLKQQYGSTLFFGTPFAMGALTAFLFNRQYRATNRETVQLTICMFVFSAGTLFLLAFDGAICIAMAFPLGLAAGMLGALVGRSIARFGSRQIPPAISAMLLLPLSIAIQPRDPAHVTHEVRSAVVINAPPERVWPHVIAFRPILTTPDFISRLGVAYPQYARIEGSGVRAVRYCVFSTGPFVEPITHWEPGVRLGFDVVKSPNPLRELSPYKNLSPPHLNGYLQSRRGEFRLVALPGGRTRLEGSTWYELEMAPEAYWQLWSDFMIHRIHNRVLGHIKKEAEDTVQKLP